MCYDSLMQISDARKRRRRRPSTARTKIVGVIAWARSASFHEIADELGDVLKLLPADALDKRP
jgi:hypothetical protein